MSLMHEVTADEVASVRAIQREANALADKVCELFENGYRVAAAHREEAPADTKPSYSFRLPRAASMDEAST